MLSPWKEVKNLVKGFLKSMMFVGFYMVIVRRTICEFTRFYKFTSLSAAAGAILGGLALIFETKSRQAEIALYCVNKSIETAYSLLRRRNYPVGLPYGECILLGVATAIICYLYSDCHKAFESKYTKVLDRLIGTIWGKKYKNWWFIVTYAVGLDGTSSTCVYYNGWIILIFNVIRKPQNTSDWRGVPEQAWVQILLAVLQQQKIK